MITNSTTSLEQLQKENEALKGTIKSLQEQLAWFTRQIFGKRSEKYVATDSPQDFFPGFNFENPPEENKPKTELKKERKCRKPKGTDTITWPDNLPVERIIIDISEEEKICAETGLSLVKIGEEKTSKLAHKPGSYYIKEIIRPKYGNPQKSEEGILTANLPETLLTRCTADESFLADILIKKFADHLPLNRISEILGRDGINISRQVLSNWAIKAGLALKPLYNEMQKKILESGNVFIDEVPVKMLSPGKGSTHQAYMWVIVGGKNSNPPYRAYNFRTTRQHHHAAEILKGYRGILHSDKYGAYESLANTKQFIWCPCWAHIRRKFIEAEFGDPPFREWVLKNIQELFKLEEEVWLLSPEERLLIRQKNEIPIIDELIEAIKSRLINGDILPKSKFKEALGYFAGLIPYLKNYTNNPWARLDNNVAERAVRPIALGRKNWLFVGNEDGGEAAAVVFSLVQTCRGLNINPREYLEDIMKKLMGHNSQKLGELLPDEWLKNRQNNI